MANYDSIAFNEASGKIGAIVFQKNGTARRRATPRNPQSDAQQAVRNGFSDASVAWKQLIPDQRAGWSRLAAQVTLTNTIGKLYSPTGRRLFISCWQNSLTALPTPIDAQANAAPLARPSNAPAFMPAVPGVGPLAVTVVTPDATHPSGQIILNCNFTSSCAVVIRATPPLSPDRNSIGPGDFRVVLARAAGGSGPTPDDLAYVYTTRFGPLASGARIILEVFQTDSNGFVSPVSRAAAFINVAQSALAPAPTDTLTLKAA